jgi:hypothetical protein
VANPFYHAPLNINRIGKPGFYGPQNTADIQNTRTTRVTRTSRIAVKLIQKWAAKVSSAATTKLFDLMSRELRQDENPESKNRQ